MTTAITRPPESIKSRGATTTAADRQHRAQSPCDRIIVGRYNRWEAQNPGAPPKGPLNRKRNIPQPPAGAVSRTMFAPATTPAEAHLPVTPLPEPDNHRRRDRTQRPQVSCGGRLPRSRPAAAERDPINGSFLSVVCGLVTSAARRADELRRRVTPEGDSNRLRCATRRTVRT